MTAKRLAALERLKRVQGEMVRLAELRLAAAARTADALTQDKARIEAFIADGHADGPDLALAVLKRQKTVETRAAAAQTAAEAQRAHLTALLRRGGALDATCRRATVSARREAEARDLAAVLESWSARAEPHDDW